MNQWEVTILKKLHENAVINLEKGEMTCVSPLEWELLQAVVDEQKRLGLATPALLAVAKELGLNVD